MIDLNRQLGQKIKELRIEKELSQKALADNLGIAQNTLAQYETGKAKPSLEVLIKIAAYFEVTTDYLLGLEN